MCVDLVQLAGVDVVLRQCQVVNMNSRLSLSLSLSLSFFFFFFVLKRNVVVV